MKVSYIIVWSDTNTLARWDSKDYSVDERINKALLKHTLFLIDQILELNPYEIFVMDNEGNFPKHKNPLVKVIPSFQSVGYFVNKQDWLDKITLDDWIEANHQYTNFNAAKSTAMAYNHGIIEASGDYLVLQHNDTKYLFDNYSSNTVIKDAIDLLESEEYEYITVDKKPPKDTSPKGYNYFADCYWFLCRGDFYSKHNIWVDWVRGDNNHLATITCEDKGLKYLHLPGFYENNEINRSDFKKKNYLENFNNKYYFENRAGNLHILNDRPFLIHFKGGTGLYRILEENRAR